MTDPEVQRMRWEIENHQNLAKLARQEAAEHEAAASRLIDDFLKKAYERWVAPDAAG